MLRCRRSLHNGLGVELLCPRVDSTLPLLCDVLLVDLFGLKFHTSEGREHDKRTIFLGLEEAPPRRESPLEAAAYQTDEGEESDCEWHCTNHDFARGG